MSRVGYDLSLVIPREYTEENMQQIDVIKLAAESTFNRFHGRVLLWGVIILILDGYDLAVVGAALPSIMKEMNIDASTAGFMASSALFGMMIGAMCFGVLSDRMGRPLTLSIGVGIFSIFTAAAGLTHDPVGFGVCRFIAGLGIGGVLPVVTAHMGEFAPVKIRARLITIIYAGYSVGGVLVALVGKQVIETYGWQSVFFVAGIPALLIPFILKTLPESMTTLYRNGRQDMLAEIAQSLDPVLHLTGEEHFVLRAEERVPNAPVKMLFAQGRGFSTLMIWLAFITGLFMVYSLSSWLTKLMAMAGYSLGSALNFVLVFNSGAIVGAIGGGWLADKFNIKHVLVTFYALGAVSLVAMGFTKETWLLFFVVFIVGGTTLGTQLLAYAYAAEFYPAAIRSTGVGFATGVGRLGAVAAPVLIGALVALHLPLERNFLAIAVAGLIGAVAVMLIDHKRSSAEINTGTAPSLARTSR
jgi:AAHS family benzoate transporter-like MFS transporter